MLRSFHVLRHPFCHGLFTEAPAQPAFSFWLVTHVLCFLPLPTY
jgi:hypothetical protein